MTASLPSSSPYLLLSTYNRSVSLEQDIDDQGSGTALTPLSKLCKPPGEEPAPRDSPLFLSQGREHVHAAGGSQ